MNRQIWIGLAEVEPLPGCKLLDEARGAYVHAMAWANDADEFKQMVTLRAADLNLRVVEIRDTEPWAIRNTSDEPLREEFYDMQQRISADVSAVAFGRFHAWLHDHPLIAPSDPAHS